MRSIPCPVQSFPSLSVLCAGSSFLQTFLGETIFSVSCTQSDTVLSQYQIRVDLSAHHLIFEEQTQALFCVPFNSVSIASFVGTINCVKLFWVYWMLIVSLCAHSAPKKVVSSHPLFWWKLSFLIIIVSLSKASSLWFDFWSKLKKKAEMSIWLSEIVFHFS